MSFALQLVVAVGLLTVVLPPYWVLSRLALRTSAPTVWLRRLVLGLLPVSVVTYVAFLLAGLGDLVRTALTAALPSSRPSVIPVVVGDVASQFALFLSGAGITLAAYAVMVPAIRRARSIDLTIRTALVRFGRYVLLLATLLTIVFVPFRWLITGENTQLAPAGLVVIVVGLVVGAPVLFRVIRDVRRPTSTERGRLDEACELAGLSDIEPWILADADETLEIHVRGLPGRRHLFVSTFALSALDEVTLEALLAVNAGQVASNYRSIKLYPLFAFILVGVTVFAVGSPLGYALVIGGALVFPLPVLWAARRAVRRGDDEAARRVGAATVADALERSATVQNLDVPSGGVLQVFKSRPALQERIDRLRERAP